MTRAGLVGFGTEHLRRAVTDRYLSDDAAQRAAHARLAAYFAGRPLGDRVVDELGWQQLGAGDTAGLAHTLADLAFTEVAYVRSVGDLRRLWVHAESAGHSMTDVYRPVLDDPAASETGPPPAAAEGSEGVTGIAGRRHLVWGVARLLTDAGHPAEALVLNRFLVDQARRSSAGRDDAPGGDSRLRAALVNLGAALWSQGDLAGADPVLREAVERGRAAEDQALLGAAMGNLAMVCRDAGRTQEASALFAEEEALCRQRGDTADLQANLGNQAQLLVLQARFDEALARIDEQEQLCLDAGDPLGVSRARAGRASILADRGDISEALALTVAHAETCREMGDRRGLLEALLNQVVMHSQLAHLDAALATAAEAESLARKMADSGMLARVLSAGAMAASMSGDWPEVERRAREAELTARNAGAATQTAVALGLIGTARREQGDLAGCRATHEEELRVAQATGDRHAVAVATVNLGTCDLAEQRWADALERYGQAEPVLTELRAYSTLLPILANRAQVHHQHQDLAAAVADYARAADAAARLGVAASAKQWGEQGIGLAYQVGDTANAESLWSSLVVAYRALGDDAALQRALGEQALLCINRAQPAGAAGDATNVDHALLTQAAALLDEQDVLCRRLGDQVGLAACVGNQAIVLRYQGDLAEALACVEEQLGLAQAGGNAQGVLFATANRGELLGLLGRVPEALDALHQARRTAAGYGPQLQAMVAQLDQMIADLQSRN